MVTTLTPPARVSTFIERLVVCRYVNQTSSMQIVRLPNANGAALERVVLPLSTVVFKTTSESFLEVYTHEEVTSVLSARIPCESLVV